METGSSGPRRSAAYAVTFLLLVLGNGPVLPLVACFLRHVTLTSSTWRDYLIASLVIGVAVPLSIVAAVGLVSLVRRDPGRPPRLMFLFALLWSAPGLISNHNAISDLRHGPTTAIEQVTSTAIQTKDEGQGNNVHIWHYCTLTFADGSQRELDRYAVKYSFQDPCHGIQAGERLRFTVLPHVDEVVAIDDLGRGGD